MSWLPENLDTILLAVSIQVAVIGVLGLLAGFGFGRNVARRHAILLVAMISTLMTPLLFSLVLWTGFSVSVPTAFRSSNNPSGFRNDPRIIERSGEAMGGSVLLDGIISNPTESVDQNLSGNAGWAVKDYGGITLGKMICSVWLLGSILFLAGTLLAGVRARFLLRTMRPLDLAPYGVSLEETGFEQRVFAHLGTTGRVSVPSVVGVLGTPSILIPARYLETISKEELLQVLIHEAAHIFRRDPLIKLLQEVCRALFWWHPIVYVLNRHLDATREELCDNFVLKQFDSDSYGETLLRLATVSRGIGGCALGLGLLGGQSLEDRIRGLIDDRRTTMTRDRSLIPLSMFAVFVSLSFLVAGTTASAQSPDEVLPEKDVEFSKTTLSEENAGRTTVDDQKQRKTTRARARRPQAQKGSSLESRVDRIEKLLEQLLEQQRAPQGSTRTLRQAADPSAAGPITTTRKSGNRPTLRNQSRRLADPALPSGSLRAATQPPPARNPASGIYRLEVTIPGGALKAKQMLAQKRAQLKKLQAEIAALEETLQRNNQTSPDDFSDPSSP